MKPSEEKRKKRTFEEIQAKLCTHGTAMQFERESGERDGGQKESSDVACKDNDYP